MQIDRIDHLVLTVSDIQTTVNFYTSVLGMEEVTFGGGRKALRFRHQKINLHQFGSEFEPKAGKPTPGSADLCFITNDPIENVKAHIGGNRREAAIRHDKTFFVFSPLNTVFR